MIRVILIYTKMLITKYLLIISIIFRLSNGKKVSETGPNIAGITIAS